MTDQTKKGKTTKDYISQIKKDTETHKDTKLHEDDDAAWVASDEEEVQPKLGGVVVEQGKVGTEKPRKLMDIFGESTDAQRPKPKNKKPTEV